jgi:divinyl protochlorophyllide a 8-vinyl-reductase
LPAAGSISGHDRAGRIGPNAILQVRAALDQLRGRTVRERVFALAGVALPDNDAGLVPETDCHAVHEATWRILGEGARPVLHLAGRLTGDYILHHRIPQPVQAGLQALPPIAGGALLALAIRHHAWTFAGSGRFSIVGWRPLVFEIADNPLHVAFPKRRSCIWHVGVFERLFGALIWPGVTVQERQITLAGGVLCRFAIFPGSGPEGEQLSGP